MSAEVVSGRRSPRTAVRQLLVDSPGSLGARTRRRRWEMFAALFPEVQDMRVVDLGGTAESWRRAPVRPAQVTVVNLTEPGESDDDWLLPVVGDACDARTALERAGLRGDYDLVFSNSLLEHVGGHARRADLAAEVLALAPCHWVQTPYRYFPVEPHWLFPGMQFLPARARVRVARSWPLVHTRPSTPVEAVESVLWTELVSITELRHLFPGSDVVHERIAGLVKSITAVRTP